MKNDDLSWIVKWYHDHCDGDWEHDKRIHIGTIDNPGWSITINLVSTELKKKEDEKIKIDRSKNDWFVCFKKDYQFEGRCGPLNLHEILNSFRTWGEAGEKSD